MIKFFQKGVAMQVSEVSSGYSFVQKNSDLRINYKAGDDNETKSVLLNPYYDEQPLNENVPDRFLAINEWKYFCRQQLDSEKNLDLLA